MLCSLNFLSFDWHLSKPREGVSVPASRGTTLCRDWICSLALLGSWVLHSFPQVSLLNSDHKTMEQWWIVTSIQVENLQQLIFGKNLEGLGPRFFLQQTESANLCILHPQVFSLGLLSLRKHGQSFPWTRTFLEPSLIFFYSTHTIEKHFLHSDLG